ncbi:MAG: tRNA (adenosine(37)-N6)-dimethylallyltransferase MiaA [Clostridia bacterium]|nr:tRNA (adenosine(37)-N6)-dimethylallyltransferase MiaA [Clostridia bacterium]
MAFREILTRLPAVVGPTASGKTALAIALGKRLDCEIISCDSMQIYREMDIGTAKPSREEQAALPHHLIDFLLPGTPYSAADYASDAYRTVEDILSRGRLPLFCGGTGLYLDAARRGGEENCEIPGATAVRERLAQEAAEQGNETLWQRLSEVDPAAAEATHPNNIRRVIRALEIYETTGIPKSEWDRRTRERPPALHIIPLMLTYPEREVLYRRMDARVDEMLRAGLAEEAGRLYEKGYLAPGSTAAQAIGYKELLPYLRGECSLDDARRALCLATRHYAKRQLTWFERDRSIIRLQATDEKGGMRPLEELAECAVREFRAAQVKVNSEE